MHKLLHEPLLHFLLLGAALFVVFGVVGQRTREEPEHIVITPGQIASLTAGFTRTWQRPPNRGGIDRIDPRRHSGGGVLPRGHGVGVGA